MFDTIYSRGKILEDTLQLTWVRVVGQLHFLRHHHTKPLAFRGAIPLKEVRRQNAGQLWVRKISSAEQIFDPVQHLHRRLPANVLREFVVQYLLDTWRELSRSGMLLVPVPKT